MSKSKALAIINPKALVTGGPLDPLVAAQWHQYVIAAGAISAASAIMCGQALVTVQKQLKGTGQTFDQWFEKHGPQLNFSRRTATNYIGAFKDTKAKLLKSGSKSIISLLEGDARKMSNEDRVKLLNAVKKCIGAQTLMDIYLEAEIVKNVHKAPMRIGGATQEQADAEEFCLEKEIEEQLELFGQNSLLLQKTVKVGKEDVLLISRWPKAKIDTAIDIRKREIQMLVKVRGAQK